MSVCVGMDVEGVHPERLAASTDEVGKRLGHREASLAGSLCDTLIDRVVEVPRNQFHQMRVNEDVPTDPARARPGRVLIESCGEVRPGLGILEVVLPPLGDLGRDALRLGRMEDIPLEDHDPARPELAEQVGGRVVEPERATPGLLGKSFAILLGQLAVGGAFDVIQGEPIDDELWMVELRKKLRRP